MDKNTCTFYREGVRFNDKVEIHYLYCWNYAYRQARKGEWEKAYLDRLRFQKRIEELSKKFRIK